MKASLAAGLALALFVAGCSARISPPVVVDEGDGDPRAAWARVLDQRVDERGRVDFEGLRDEPADLARFVAWLASTSPENASADFAGDGQALAYWIEAHNALAMYSVAHVGARPEDEREFFHRNRFLVGGAWMSLAELREEHVLAPGDERALFALDDMSRGAPRLRRAPLEPRRIDVELDARAREFFGSDENLLVRPEIGSVYLSRILQRNEARILAAEGSFVAYANRYLDSQLLARTFVRWLDYDWSLDSQ